MTMKKTPASKTEEYLLLLSLLLELLFGIAGIAVSKICLSQAVLLDGSYSLLCTLTMAAAIYVARRIKQSPDAHYPFGQAALEPLMLIAESIILLMLCGVLAGHAIQLILKGGVQLNYSVVLGYEAASLITGFAMTIGMKIAGQKLNSQLILFESREWLLDMTLSGIALISFSVSLRLPENSKAALLTDPILTLIFCLPLMYFPLSCLRKNIQQLIWHSASEPEQEIITNTVEKIARERSITLQAELSVVIIGRSVWISVPVALQSDTGNAFINIQLIKLRHSVEQQLHDQLKGYRLYLVIT